ncbi:MAG TPA: DNA-directed RNA polymerase subunit omega [Bacteroidota bacterium]|jgi:DNA-directed RNA polymerase subunit K/omega|nr:DNA-directed RNA polymerase subunit omega [Bacteroidota bacterium]
MGLKPVDLDLLSKTAENIYEAIVVMSKRARQINDEYKLQMNMELETLSTKSSDEEVETNPDQMNISMKFEKLPKPTHKALEEMQKGELRFRYKEFV